MPRAETNDSLEQDQTVLTGPSRESENIAEHLNSITLNEFEGTSNPNGFDDSETVLESQKENGFFDNKKYGCHEIGLLKHNQYNNWEVKEIKAIPPPDESSWRERNSLKIRYTRQYLLDRRFEPLSTAFPECLLEYLQSEDVPLKQETYYDQKSVDHILFYTTLPYTRRMPFQQCYF